MRVKAVLPLSIGLLILGGLFAQAAEEAELKEVAPTPPARTYVVGPNDLLLIKVYRQDDLESRVRIAADGTSTLPLLGTINLGGKTLEEATAHVRELLEKDYLVNPQVSVTILEYAKRRFTVLGQVQKPGTFEIPSEESVNLLEGIAMAGGFTRLANSAKVTVTRTVNRKKVTLVLDAKTMTDGSTSHLVILPEDTITVPQRIL